MFENVSNAPALDAFGEVYGSKEGSSRNTIANEKLEPGETAYIQTDASTGSNIRYTNYLQITKNVVEISAKSKKGV